MSLQSLSPEAREFRKATSNIPKLIEDFNSLVTLNASIPPESAYLLHQEICVTVDRLLELTKQSYESMALEYINASENIRQGEQQERTIRILNKLLDLAQKE